MRHRWSVTVLVTGLIGVAFLTGGWLNRPEPAPNGTVYQQARLFEDVLSAIRQHYIDSISETDLYLRATRGIVDHLNDPYSALLVNEGYRRYTEQLSGIRDGLGLQLDLRGGKLVVVTATPGSPADRAGIVAGDRILAVDGVSTKGWNVGGAVEALRGDAGTEVVLLVDRAGLADPISYRIVRSSVHVPATSPGLLLDSGAAIVTLRTISAASAEELRQQIGALADQGMTGLILDLRYNPGGVLNQAVDIAELFLDPGQAVGSLRGRDGEVTEFVADATQPWPDLPVVVLVNHGTASAAEIIAGALQDHDRAVVVGTPSFGKGAVQSTIPLGRNVAVKLTTALWYTPSGRTVQRPLPPPSDEGEPGTAPGAPERIFLSDSGRPLQDASGVIPDLIVPGERPLAAKRALASTLGGDLSRFHDVLDAYVDELAVRGEVSDPEFRVSAAMRRGFYQRLEREGLTIPLGVYERATPFVERELGDRLTRVLFGDEAARERRLREDAQLQAATVLLSDRERMHALLTPGASHP